MTISRSHSGFTLVEILIAIAVLAIISTVVIVAINPEKNILSAHDSKREVGAQTVRLATSQYIIEEMGVWPSSAFPTGLANAKPICKITTSAEDCAAVDGINLSNLVTEYVVQLPQDPAEPDESPCTGFIAYKAHGHPYVVPAHIGVMPGEVEEACSLGE